MIDAVDPTQTQPGPNTPTTQGQDQPNPFAEAPTNNPPPPSAPPGAGSAPPAGEGAVLPQTAAAIGATNLAAQASGQPGIDQTAAASTTAPSVPEGQAGLDTGALAPGVTLGASDIDRRAQLIINIHPTLAKDPQTLLQLAELPVTDDALVGSVGKAAISTAASVQAQILNDLADPHARWDAWKRLPTQLQQAVLSTGVTAPTDPNTHSGFWGNLAHNLNPVRGFFGAQGGLVRGVVDAVTAPLTIPAQLVGAAGHVARHDIADPAGAVVNRDVAQPLGISGATEAVSRGLGNAMYLPSHAYKFLSYDPRTGGSHPIFGPEQAPVTDPNAPRSPGFSWHWVSQAWENTSQGKPFYSDHALATLNKALPNNVELQALAKLVAKHGGDLTAAVADVIGKNPTPAAQAKASQLFAQAQTAPGFVDAVKALSAGGVSFGRDGARSFGLREGTAGYAVTSGALDGVYQWYANPAMAAGKLRAVPEAARSIGDGAMFAKAVDRAKMTDEIATAAAKLNPRDPGFWPQLAASKFGPATAAPEGSDLFRRLVLPSDTVAQRRFAVAMAAHYNTGDAAGWVAAYPKAAGAYQSFVEHATNLQAALADEGVDRAMTGNDVLHWLKSPLGSTAVADGSLPAYLSHNDIAIPRLSRLGALRTMAKTRMVPLGRLADTPVDPADLAATDPGAVPGAPLRVLSGISNRIYQQLRPSNTDGPVMLVGPEALPSFERFVSQFGLHPDQRAGVLNAFSQAEGTAARRDIALATMDAGLKRLAGSDNEQWRKAVDALTEARRQSYDPHGLDILPSDRRATLFPDVQAAKAISMPTIRDIAAAARQANAGHAVTRFLGPEGMAETFMHKYWTVAALMRLGFIPRVVTEEWMTALMRLRPSQIGSAYFGSLLPGWQDRFASWDPFAGKGPASFARILANHALGGTLKAIEGRLDPTVVSAGRQVYNSRQLVRHGRKGWADLMDAAGGRAEAATLLGLHSDDAAGAADELVAKRDELRAVFERISHDPIVRRAWGKAVFSTGGGYRGATSLTDDVAYTGSGYHPVERINMRGVRRSFAGASWGKTADPGFRQAVSDYFDELGRSPVAREQLRAIQGWAPSDAEAAQLHGALGGSITELRHTFASLPEHQQDLMRHYTAALGSGDPDQLRKAGLKVRALLADDQEHPILSDAQRRLVSGMHGDPAYWDRQAQVKIPAELLAGAGPDAARSAGHVGIDELPHRIRANTLAHVFADPAAGTFSGRDEAVRRAAEAGAAHMHSAAFRDTLASSDHILHSPAGDLADPVAPDHTRVYYPDPDMIPAGGTDPDSLMQLVGRARRGQTIGGRHPTSLEAIGYTNPDIAAAVAARSSAPLKYVDIPTPVARAQNLADPKGTHPNDMWHRHVGHTLDATHEMRDDLLNRDTLDGRPIPDTTWITTTQAGNARTLDGSLTRLPDGTIAPGVTLKAAIDSLAHRQASSLVDAFAPRGQLLHGVVDSILRHDGQSTLTARHLTGLADNELPPLVTAGEHITLPPDHLYSRIVRFGFDRMLGPSIDALVRTPLFTLNYAKAMRAARIVEPHLVDQQLRTYAHKALVGSGLDTHTARDALTQKRELEDLQARGIELSPEAIDARFPLAEAADGLIDRLAERDEVAMAAGKPIPAPVPDRFRPGFRGWFMHGTADPRDIGPIPWDDPAQLYNLYGPGFYTTESEDVARGYAGDPDASLYRPNRPGGLRPLSMHELGRAFERHGQEIANRMGAEFNYHPLDVNQIADQAHFESEIMLHHMDMTGENYGAASRGVYHHMETLLNEEGLSLGGDSQPAIHRVTWAFKRDPRLLDLDRPPSPALVDALRTVWGPQVGYLSPEEAPPGHDFLEGAVRGRENFDRLVEGLRSGDRTSFARGVAETALDRVHHIGFDAGTLMELLLRSHDLDTVTASGENAAMAAFRQLHSILGNQGYDGYTHIGGWNVGSEAHRVRIFFHPDAQLAYDERDQGAHEAALHAWSDMEDHVDDHLRQIAVTRAVTDTVPYINNHNTRSNMAEWGRNIAPFGWAQESFYKRWWRAHAYTPDNIMRLELGIHGFASMGIVHKDPYGQDAISFPGSAQLVNALTQIGIPHSVAQAVPFSAEVRNLTPGFARPTVPAFGPLVTVPIGLMSARSVAPSPLDQTIQGPSTPSGLFGIAGQLLPSSFLRNVASALDTHLDPQQYASARMQALQALAAGGHLPPINATATEIQTFNDRLNTWTKNALLLRAFYGFVSPATPQLDFSSMHLPEGETVGQVHTDMQDLISLYGVNQGIARFISIHPDATPYTVFRSTTAGMLAPPSTTAALDALAADHGFYTAHPASGAYFLPQGQGPYNRNADLAETAAGMRRAKGWTQIVTEMVTAAASQTYYAGHDLYLAALNKAAASPAQRSQVTKAWSAWSKDFLARNPLFDTELTSSTSSATRAAVLADMKDALASPNTPAGPQTDHLRTMIEGYQSWVGARQPLVGVTSAETTSRRAQMDGIFARWAQLYAQDNPDVAAFYSRIIVPEITTADRAVGQQLEALNVGH